MDLDPVLLSRVQFGFLINFHRRWTAGLRTVVEDGYWPTGVYRGKDQRTVSMHAGSTPKAR